MTTQKFARQIESLLFIGAIQGDQILSLYHLLKCYEQGDLTAQDMQTAIDQCDPDQIDKVLNEEFPHLFE
jgi:hypothetical protein